MEKNMIEYGPKQFFLHILVDQHAIFHVILDKSSSILPNFKFVLCFSVTSYMQKYILYLQEK